MHLEQIDFLLQVGSSQRMIPQPPARELDLQRMTASGELDLRQRCGASPPMKQHGQSQQHDQEYGVPIPGRDQLFEPFHSGKPSGVGIGLALSQRIARAHGGQLVLAPSERGATFVLTLPGGTA